MNLYSIANGNYKNIEEVKDDAFSQKMLGDGLAVVPLEGKVYSPCSAKIIMMFPTKHAYGLELENGAQLLIHIGIDTVELNEGTFKSRFKVGDLVERGDLITEFDLDFIKLLGFQTDIIITVTNYMNYTIDITKNITLSLNDRIMGIEKNEVQNN